MVTLTLTLVCRFSRSNCRQSGLAVFSGFLLKNDLIFVTITFINIFPHVDDFWKHCVKRWNWSKQCFQLFLIIKLSFMDIFTFLSVCFKCRLLQNCCMLERVIHWKVWIVKLGFFPMTTHLQMNSSKKYGEFWINQVQLRTRYDNKLCCRWLPQNVSVLIVQWMINLLF